MSGPRDTVMCVVKVRVRGVYMCVIRVRVRGVYGPRGVWLGSGLGVFTLVHAKTRVDKSKTNNRKTVLQKNS